MSIARVIQYGSENQINLPVSGHGSALKIGAFLKKGGTPSADNGHLQLASGTTGNKILAILQEAHATANDTDVPGTIFTKHPCDLVTNHRVIRLEYSVASGDLITCTQAVSSSSLTLASLETNIHAAFLYVVSGLGAGQTNYLTASGAGTGTLKAAFGTSLDTTSKIIKILPRFHELMSLTSDGLRLSSQAAAGAIRCVVMDTIICRNNNETSMDPTAHSALTKLNSLASLRFEAEVVLVDTIVYQLA